jgi:hypothetical protein
VAIRKVLQDCWTVVANRCELDTLRLEALFCVLQLHELRFAEGHQSPERKNSSTVPFVPFRVSPDTSCPNWSPAVKGGIFAQRLIQSRQEPSAGRKTYPARNPVLVAQRKHKDLNRSCFQCVVLGLGILIRRKRPNRNVLLINPRCARQISRLPNAGMPLKQMTSRLQRSGCRLRNRGEELCKPFKLLR